MLLGCSLRTWPVPRLPEWRALAWIGGVALIARLAPVLLIPEGSGYDIGSYQIVAQLLANGQDVYSATEAVGRHPYLPLQMYWMLGAYHISFISGWPFAVVVRWLPLTADASIAVVIFWALRRTRIDLPEAWRGGLLYALNPVTILVSVYHGQFDALPSLLLILAWLIWETRPVSRSRVAAALSAGMLGLAVWDKSWPILFLPLILVKLPNWPTRVFYSLVVGVLPLLGLGFYTIQFGGEADQIIAVALGYNHGVGIWGYPYLVWVGGMLGIWPQAVWGWLVGQGRWITLVILGVIFWWRARHLPLMPGLLLLLLAFLAFGHAFSIQYLTWVIPFGMLVRDWSWLRRYILATSSYMLLAYFTLILAFRIDYWLPWPQANWYLIMPMGLPAWIITVFWTSHWWRRGDVPAHAEESASVGR